MSNEPALATRLLPTLGIGARLAVNSGVLVAVALSVVVVASLRIVDLRDAQRALVHVELAKLATLQGIGMRLHGIRAGLVSMISASAVSESRSLRTSELRNETAELRELLRKLDWLGARNQSIAKRLARLKYLFEAFVLTRDSQIIPALERGRLARAQALAHGVQSVRYLEARSLVRELEYAFRERAVLASVRSDQLARRTLWLIFVGAGLIVLAAAALTAHLDRSVARPIRTVADLAAQIAAGDLRVKVPGARRRDEVGALLGSFDAMVTTLRGVHGALRDGISVLTTEAARLDEAATHAGGAAAETSSAVAQSVAATEQIRLGAAHARSRADQMAEHSAELTGVSGEGRRGVDLMVGDIELVHEQMHTLAELMVALTERAESIGDVIVTIDDLAAQSNLLAVNAAMEAAGAAEYGVGFRVVADEMRTLANRSRAATSQVRATLLEIEGATRRALTAAQAADAAAAAGHERTRGTGEAFAHLTQGVEQAAQAAREMAAASSQQAEGVEQVAGAMRSIGGASNEHEDTVRQVAGAAREIARLGERLDRLAGQLVS